MGILLAIAAMICWGTADFFAAKTGRSAGSFLTLFWSQITSLCIYIIIFLLFFQWPHLGTTDLIVFAIAGTLSVLAYAAFYKGLQIGIVAVISPVSACWGIITVILSFVFLNERVGNFQMAGIILAIMGAILTSFRAEDLKKLKFKSYSKGLSYALFNMIGTGLVFVFLALFVRKFGWFFPIFFIRAIGVAYLLLYVFATQKKVSISKNIVLPVALIGLLEALGCFAYDLSLAHQYTAISAPISAVYPMITVILARIFFKEKLVFNQKVGVISVFAGLVLLAI